MKRTYLFVLPAGVAIAVAVALLRTAPAASPLSPERAIATPPSRAIATVPPSPSVAASPCLDDRLADRDLLRRVIPSLEQPVADWRHFTPATLTVAPVPGLPLEFTVQSVARTAAHTTWIGTNPVQGTTLVACGTETLWDAIITVPGADEYSIHVTPDTVQVIETAHGNAACGPEKHSGLRLAATTSATTAAPSVAAATSTGVQQTSDLFVLYSTGAKNNWGSTEEMVNRITTVVATMNTYLAQSQIDNLRWNLVGTAEAPAYTTTEKLEDDLDRLADTTTELGRFAALKRAEYGADQVLFIVDGTRDYAGIAFVPGHLAVVHHPGSAATAAHELAHNFGCRHDRQEAKATDSDGRYFYGHRYSADGRDTGTIMSYAASVVPYYSNPAITYQGFVLGVAAGAPKAADNARWLREHAEDIAGLVPSKTVTAPVITSQPLSVTVDSGRPFSLSVIATGNQLNYQWALNGVDITGATTAIYSKYISTAADAGAYTVLVSNSAGSVRSNTATVAVSTTPTQGTSTTTPTASSGGGGGGAFGLATVFGLLTLLGAARRAGTLR